MNSAASSSSSSRSPFTASQWQELEHQALIFKYMMAGIPVPPDLLLPIRKSFESMASRFYHHPTLSYCSLYGKKVDPEPGRCRRTDGKKWRCSKDAYPDSKYCERHMHRGRNRSRKPVEAQTPPSQSSSTVTVPIPTTATAGGPTFQSIPSLLSASNPQALYSTAAAANNTRLQMETGSYGIGMPSKDYRYLHESKGEVDEHSFFSEASGNVRGLGVDSSVDSAWGLMPSRVSSFPTSKPRNGSIPQSNYSQMQTLQGLENTPITSTLPKQHHQQHCFFGSEFGPSEPVVKQEGQSLRPFFDEWPKTRDSWPDLEDERSNHNSFSTTQLSISIPMTSSNLSTTTSRSLNDE